MLPRVPSPWRCASCQPREAQASLRAPRCGLLH
ncbi:hypothetical protein EKK58_05705 [Candidatus Dependentiae bacterium]|nr:MAG: hypothetical protein EKK58_05705 [Candidatus Dependentiae bacterium]